MDRRMQDGGRMKGWKSVWWMVEGWRDGCRSKFHPRRKPKPQGVSKDSLLRSRAGPPHGLSEKALMHTCRATTHGETRPSRPRAPSTCLECAVSSGEARNERPSGSAVLSRGVS